MTRRRGIRRAFPGTIRGAGHDPAKLFDSWRSWARPLLTAALLGGLALGPTVSSAQDVPGEEGSSPTGDLPKPDGDDMKDDSGKAPQNGIGDPDYANVKLFNSATAEKVADLLKAIRKAIADCDKKAYDAAVKNLREYQSIGFELENDPIANPDNALSTGQLQGKTAAEIQKLKDDYVKQYKAAGPRGRRAQRNNGTMDISTAPSTSYPQWETLEFDLIRIRRIRPPAFPEKCEPKTAGDAPADPPKTGTGTGQPVKPPEPPKAPSDSPGKEHGMAPSFKLRADIFGVVAWMPQFGAGTFFPGGQRANIIDSPGTIAGAGFGVGIELPTSLVIAGFEPWWSFDIGFAGAGGTNTGTVAPGGPSVAFDYIAPNPASGLPTIIHFTNGQYVSVRGHRNQFDVNVLYNAKLLQYTLNTIIPKTDIEINAGAGFQYRAIWDSFEVGQSIINFPDVTSLTNLDSSMHFLAPRFMLRAEVERGPFSFYVGVYVAPGVVFGSGSADQRARCPVCAVAEQSVNLRRDDSFSAFAVNAGVRAWVAYDITPRVTAWAFAGYDYFSSTATWKLDPGNAHLVGKSTGDARFGVALKMRF